MSNTTNDITLPSGLVYYRDWDCDGAIYMRNAKTIDRYREINDQHPDLKPLGVFVAFSDKQFEQGLAECKKYGSIKDTDKVYRYNGGFFGKRDGYVAMLRFYSDRLKLVKDECDPQEVYFYEYNNHECMISWDGDDDAIQHIIDIWGVEKAKTITRYNAAHTIDWLVMDEDTRHTISMLGRLKADCEYYLGHGNRYAGNLWARDERKQIEAMRLRLAPLPDEHKPDWLTEEMIDEFETAMCNTQPAVR